VNAMPAVRERFASQGAAPMVGDGVALGQRIERELATWTRIVAEKNIRP
jgi:tripartite-type tricarboxylate transporter receptor subunit TctC